jgi:hypothetical protein
MSRIPLSLLVIVFPFSTLHSQTRPAVAACDSAVVALLPPVYSWRLVRGDGFTFCVPDTWKAVGKGGKESDARQWSYRSTWIKWGVGAPGQQLVSVKGTVTMTGSVPRFEPTTQIGEDRITHEVIGGNPAQLSIQQIDYDWLSSASWNSPPLWFQGHASSARDGDLTLAIYRSVQFAQ